VAVIHLSFGAVDAQLHRLKVLSGSVVRCPRQILAIARPKAPKLDQVQGERLDLRQYAVQGGTIQNTGEKCVSALHLRDHRRKR